MRARSNKLKVMIAASLSMTAAASPAAAQLPSRTISPDWFAGMWSDNPDCSAAVQFFRDGTYRTSTGAQARWRIERGNVVVLEGPGGREELPLERVDDRQLRHIESGVSSYRCDAGTVTADWLIGTWSDPRDCSEPFHITRAGDFRAPNGVLGRWSLAGDALTLTFGANRQTYTIIRISDNELRLAETGVSSYRCG